MRSPELAKLAAVTAAVAASTTKVIWELVRELESVLLALRDDTRDCLELLDEERLALSSAITVEAIDSGEELAELEDSSFLEHEANINGKNIMVENSILFTTSFFKNFILSEIHKIFALKDFILVF